MRLVAQIPCSIRLTTTLLDESAELADQLRTTRSHVIRRALRLGIAEIRRQLATAVGEE